MLVITSRYSIHRLVFNSTFRTYAKVSVRGEKQTQLVAEVSKILIIKCNSVFRLTGIKTEKQGA